MLDMLAGFVGIGEDYYPSSTCARVLSLDSEVAVEVRLDHTKAA
jgi:hypothetical protein